MIFLLVVHWLYPGGMCTHVKQLLDSHDWQGRCPVGISRYPRLEDSILILAEKTLGGQLWGIYKAKSEENMELGAMKYPSVNLWLELLCHPGHGVHPDELAEPVWRRRCKTRSTEILAEQVWRGGFKSLDQRRLLRRT